jgi:hypothetical protein
MRVISPVAVRIKVPAIRGLPDREKRLLDVSLAEGEGSFMSIRTLLQSFYLLYFTGMIDRTVR